MLFRRTALLAPIVLSCRAADVPPPQAGAAPPAPSVIDGGQARTAPKPSVPEGPTLEALPPRAGVADARVTLSLPASDEPLAREAALALPIRIAVAGVSDEAGARVMVLLDGDGYASLDAAGALTVGELLPADQMLGDGLHRVEAFLLYGDGNVARGSAGVVTAAATFSVGRRTPPPSGPRVLILQPRGTYNGDPAADSAVFAVVVRPATAADSLRVEISGEGTRTVQTVRAEVSYRIRGLRSGDYRFASTLLGSEPPARATRTITVNRDAPLPQ